MAGTLLQIRPKTRKSGGLPAVERLAWSLKYMHVVDERPEVFEDDVLKQLYRSSEFANLSVEQQFEYEEKMFNWLDGKHARKYVVTQ